jgi:membrane-bound lytic murein transglycosylase D
MIRILPFFGFGGADLFRVSQFLILKIKLLEIKRREKSIRSALFLACCVSTVAILLPACSSTAKKPVQKEAFVVRLPSEASVETLAGSANSRAGKPRRTGAGTIPANPADYENLWDRLIDQYSLPELQHREIDKEVAWFVSHPTYIDRVQKRAEPFLYSIVRQIEKYDVPGEIALLPVIESAFQPHVVSPASAAGIWQFIPATGKNFGLKRSRSYDGRRDVYASTRAAIKYLKKLQNDFQGDWLLAVAAYNCGEGTVGKAVQRNQSRGLPTDFWSLDLPQETRSYVPRLLAVSRIFADPARYGVDVRPIPNKAMYKTVKVTSPLDLALAAQAADLTLEQMLELNPGFKHPVADVDGTYRLFVPANKYQSFKEQLPQMVDAKASVFGSKDYGQLLSDGGVQLGSDTPDDTTDASSAEFSASSAIGSEYETDRTRRRYAAPSTQVAVNETMRGSNSGDDEQQSAYTTRRGDTLASIARQNGVSEAQLKTWNHLSGRAALRPGTKLVLLGHQHSDKNTHVSFSETSADVNSTTKGAHASSRRHGREKSGKYAVTGHADTHSGKAPAVMTTTPKSKSKNAGAEPAAVAASDTKKATAGSHHSETPAPVAKKAAPAKAGKKTKP